MPRTSAQASARTSAQTSDEIGIDDPAEITAVLPPVRERPRRFVFLDVLRASAVCLVVYSHLVGVWLDDHHVRSATEGIVTAFVEHPLLLAQHLGNLGVVLFFLVSGFVVTHTGLTEGFREFAVKRLLRIYPMLVVAVLIAGGLFAAGLHPLTTGQPTTVTPMTLLTNATLANYVTVPEVVLLAVGWSLIVEMLFYLLLLVILPVLRWQAWLGIVVELAVIAAVLGTAHEAGQSYFLLAVSMSYLPALVIGQVAWAMWSRRVPRWAGVIFGAIAWMMYLWAGANDMGRLDGAYDHTLALGLGVFVVGLLAERRLRPNSWVSYLAERSYSLYLLHGLLGFALMDLLYPRAPFLVVLLAGIAATGLAAEGAYRWVERPCMRFARFLGRRWSPR
ncbi:MAG TPA: acyltransferase [Pseudonocardiaceae bacterium]